MFGKLDQAKLGIVRNYGFKVRSFFWAIRFILVYLFVFSSFLFAQNENGIDQSNLKLVKEAIDISKCKIRGRVLSFYDFSLILGVSVSFESGGKETHLPTEARGKYEIELSNDTIYSVRAVSAGDSYKRSKLGVSCKKGEVKVINVYPMPKVVSYGDESLDYLFETFSFKNSKMDAVVSYLEKERRKDRIIYRISVLTYDDFTLSARKITRYPKNNIIEAEGDAWLEDGEKRTHFDKFTIRFSKGGAVITCEKPIQK